LSGQSNQFEGFSSGIRSLLLRLGFPVAQDERGEDLLELPGHSEIQFNSISPSDQIRDTLSSLTELSAGWVRKHTDEFAFQLALQLAGNGHVQFQSGSRTLLNGTVTDLRSTHSVSIAFSANGLSSTCDCAQSSRPSNGNLVPCEHVAALMLDVIAEKRIPLSAVTEIDPLCPVTRQKLTGMRIVYRCSRCGLNMSPEGWEFLRAMDKGKCCSCGARGTIAPRPAATE
jgi:DNA-directed RNA polymerase subunit RPC12/RpoP